MNAIEALQWCVENNGECLGDHPGRLALYRAIVATPAEPGALAASQGGREPLTEPRALSFDPNREAFEKWFLDYCGQGPEEGPALFDQAAEFWLEKRPEDGNYENTRVRDSWLGWQGCTAFSFMQRASALATRQPPSEPGGS